VITAKDKKFLKLFGKRLASLRKVKGLSQLQLAHDAGISKNQVGLIERGEINTTIITLKTLSETLEVHPFELLNF
jgi:transcriptional regulator with XRE-family HTH domain